MMRAQFYVGVVVLVKIPLCFLLSCTTAVDFAEDWKGLLKQYSYLCGKEHICDENVFSNTTHVEHENISMSCPKCNCDDFCPITGECCIDIEVNTCVRTSYGPEWPDKMFYMKNYCPSNTEKKLVSRCQATNANENMLERNPVTSKSTNITYSNIYCARCNNDVNVLSWSIATNCIIKLDTFTTLDELWNYILNGHLSFMFIPTEEIRTNSQVPRSCNANLINRCNITGVAKQFDYNIEKACNTLYQPIGFFQNPFCLLCNIQDETFDSPISKCNATGRIQEIDDYFRSSCLNETVNALRYPYKNEYCEECNIVRTESGDIQLRDTELTVHIYNRPVQKFLRLKTQNQVYLSEVTIGAFDFTENYSISQYLGKIKLGSIKNLQIKIPANAADFGWKKKKKWCQTAKKYFFPDNENLNPLIYEPSCSCNSNCSKLDNCCDVKGSIMNQVKKWSCVQTSLPRSNDFYSNPSFMISRCSNKYNNSVIKRLCESDNNEDLTFIPVTDSRTIKTYKNYFCFLCFTSNKNSVEEQTYIIPWKMHFECPNIFSFKYDVKLVSLMQEALSRNCRISVLPYLPYPPPMCELPGREQLYCSLCERSGKMVENCIRTNQKEPDYRSIFSVFEKVDSTRAEDPRMQCSTYEMFDMYTEKCRSFLCSSGKQLVNGQCIHMFLSFTSKIYNIAFTASFHNSVGHRRLDVDLLMKSITFIFTEELFNDTNLIVRLLHYHVRFNRKCQKIITLSELHPLQLTVFIKIHILSNYLAGNENVDRNLIENRLFKATTKKGSSGNISFEYFEDVNAWFLPNIEKAFSFDSFCNKRSRSGSSDGDEIGLDITKLLFCPQISLSTKEFTLSNDGLEIVVPVLNRTFYYNQFSIAEDRSARICSSDYKSNDVSRNDFSSQYVPSRPRTTSYNLLQILTIISTSISLVSLVVTFIVYCILRNLRSIPGKNLMCFVCSLFFAQLITLIKDTFTRYSMTCTFVGILTYYFWLSTFTSATSCCYHMFRVFVCNVQFKNKNPCDGTILIYILYTYLTPLLFISITVGYHMSRSSFTGFGGNECFIDGMDNKLFAFIIPISAFCFVNVLLFTVTFCKIYKSPELERGPSRNYISIYLKLFLLTGIAWIFQIIDGFFDISPFSYLVVVLNGSQGLYIMISYVLKGRVKRMFQEIGLPDKPRIENVKDSQCTEQIKMETSRKPSYNEYS